MHSLELCSVDLLYIFLKLAPLEAILEGLFYADCLKINLTTYSQARIAHVIICLYIDERKKYRKEG